MKKLALTALLAVASAAVFASDNTSKATSVTLNIADFVEITTPNATLDPLTVNVTGDPTAGAFWSTKANFNIRANRGYVVFVSAHDEPAAGTWEFLFGGQDANPDGNTYLQGFLPTTNEGDPYSVQARVSGLKLTDGTATRTGSITISVAVSN